MTTLDASEFNATSAPSSSSASSSARSSSPLRDLLALGKPGITMMAVIVAAGTYLLALPVVDVAAVVRGFFGLAGVGLIVMGAGAFNMVLERDVDGRMTRTRGRPVAAGRMAPLAALGVGAVWTSVAMALMWLAGPDVAGSNGRALTVVLGAFSFFLYVLVYTPMKQRSPWSLVVGAVPGAMPALMGGTLATGRVEVTGLALFAVVFLWQLPHFLAISLYRESDYVAAGHHVFPTSIGVRASKLAILLTTLPLCALGVALWPLGLGGRFYAVVAVVVGVWFSVVTAGGLRRQSRANDDAWAKRAFFGSLIWQTVVFGALAVDRFAAALFS